MHSHLADARSYTEKGYWVSPPLFGDDAIARLRLGCERVLSGKLVEPASPAFQLDNPQPIGGLRRAFNASFVDPTIREAIHHREIGAIAARLMGVRAVRLWYSQIIEKPTVAGKTEDRTTVGWHQDFRYWQCCDHSNLVTAWIALQDTSRENGAMRMVVGSNHWGLLATNRGFNFRNLDELRQELLSGVNHEWQESDCILRSGQVSFHHALTLHASGPNRSSQARTAIAIHLMPDGTLCRQADACHQSLAFLQPLPKPAQPFGGVRWPVIWGSEP